MSAGVVGHGVGCAGNVGVLRNVAVIAPMQCVEAQKVRPRCVRRGQTFGCPCSVRRELRPANQIGRSATLGTARTRMCLWARVLASSRTEIEMAPPRLSRVTSACWIARGKGACQTCCGSPDVNNTLPMPRWQASQEPACNRIAERKKTLGTEWDDLGASRQ